MGLAGQAQRRINDRAQQFVTTLNATIQVGQFEREELISEKKKPQ